MVLIQRWIARYIEDVKDHSPWPTISADVTQARELARAVRADHLRSEDDWLINQLIDQLERVADRLTQVEVDLRRPPKTPVELEHLTKKIGDVGTEHARRSSELRQGFERLSADLSQSDERVAAVEASLLRDREENNQLIGCLEEAFSRLSAFDVRLESIEASRTAQVADLEHLELRLANLPTTDDVIALSREIDVRLAELARTDELITVQEEITSVQDGVAALQESIDAQSLEIAGSTT